MNQIASLLNMKTIQWFPMALRVKPKFSPLLTILELFLAFFYIHQHVKFLTISEPVYMFFYLKYPATLSPCIPSLIFKWLNATRTDIMETMDGST